MKQFSPVQTTANAKWIGLCCTALWLVSPSMAWAGQASPAIPTREELAPPPSPVQPATAETAITADDSIERAPCPLANPEFQNIKFTLQRVEFANGGPIDTGALAASWSDLAGQSVTLAAICDIRDRAATMLRAKGYLAAIRVPEQTIADGVVRLDILTARLARIQVRGDAGPSEKLLARYLGKLENQPVFNLLQAERSLLLAREIPGLDARLSLRPSDVAGDVFGEVTVRRTPVMLDFNAQNFGTRDVGPIGLVARMRLNGLTGLGDQTSISFYTAGDAKEQSIVQLGHEMRVGGDGLKLGANYTKAWTRPDIAALPIQSTTQIASLFASYPIILRQTERLTLTGGIDAIDQDINFAGAPLNRDRLRVISLRGDQSWVDPASAAGRNGYSISEPRWAVTSSAEIRKGLSILGASDPCGPLGAACFAPGAVPLSRIEGQPDAFIARWTAQAEWRPRPDLALSVAPRTQWADAPLLAYEEFSAGNFTVGRGYDPGSLIGDTGVSVSAEARLFSLIPQSRSGIAAQPFVFFDAAWVRNKDIIAAGTGTDSIYSAGGGVRIAYGDMARLDFALAVPLKRLPLATRRGEPRFLVTLTTQFGVGSN